MKLNELVVNSKYFYGEKPGAFAEVTYVRPMGGSEFFAFFKRGDSAKATHLPLKFVFTKAEKDAELAEFEKEKAAKAAAKQAKDSTPSPRQVATEFWGNRIGEVRSVSEVTFDDDTTGRQVSVLLSYEDFEALAGAIAPFGDGEKVPYKKLKPRAKAEAAAEAPAETPAQ